MIKKILKIGLPVLVVLVYGYFKFIDKNHRGWKYAPDMAYSIAPRPYSEALNGLDNKGLLMSPEGRSVELHSTADVLDSLSKEQIKKLQNPVPFSSAVVDEGQQLFTDFCAQCHGNGDGHGLLVESKKYPPPPSFNKELKDLTPGEMFASISNGKNYMGSYKSILTVEERWKIIHYLNTLQFRVFE